MRNTIGQRILIVILAPSLLIFGLLSAFIAYAASQFAVVWADLEMKGVSEINAADLTGRVDSVRISLLSAASMLDALNAQDKDGRERAEIIIKSMFENPNLYNVWLAYEPGAFDGRDAEYTSDYPGAPSGRFIRSYVVDGGKIVTAPDMDEKTLDDPDESPWYVKPRDTGSFYADVYNDIPNLYDYGLGDDPVCTMAFAAPLHRDGRVIGCVGADMVFDVTALNAAQAAVAVFYANGHVFFAQNLAFADDSVDTLGFTAVSEIKGAFSNGVSLFLPNQYSMFLNQNAFTYFQPIAVSGAADKLYMYTAMPHSSVLDGLTPVFMLIAGIVAATLISILFILVYVKRKISNPLKALMQAAESVSHGDLETDIPSFPNSKDEIGILSRSLHRMVEQFRVYILRLEQTQDEIIIYSKIEELIASGAAAGTMESLLEIVCTHIGIDKATAARLSDGSAHVFPLRGRKAEDAGAEFSRDVPHHAKIMPMLAGKKLLIMNSYVISELGADFLDKETRFACILPLREERRTLGYVVFESRSEKNPFGVKAESILCNVAETLSDFIKDDEKGTGLSDTFPVATSHKNDASVPLDAIYGVEGLDSAAAIRTMGGMADLYEQALKLLISLLPETLERLDACVSSDIDAFAIEIHGLKGSLNNVGAYGMGSYAARVEQAAKAGDGTMCVKLYASFKDALTELYRRLIKAVEAECGKLPGNVLELVGLLPAAEEAAAANDCASALNTLRDMECYSFDLESDSLLGKILAALKALDAGKALEGIRDLRERLTNWEED